MNEAFARRTVDALRQVDRRLKEQHSHVVPIVWIHDYQLMSAAQTIREVGDIFKLKIPLSNLNNGQFLLQMAMDENLSCKLGFFLHIPFPSWDIMRLFPWDNQVLEGILGKSLLVTRSLTNR